MAGLMFIAFIILACIISGLRGGNIPYIEPPDISNLKYEEPPKDGKCRGLVLRGGGTKGAFEVGALKAFSEMMEPIDYAYDVVAGVSMGGLNAAMLASFKRGMEKVAIDYLWRCWSSMAVTDFWENWTLGPFEGLIRNSFLKNSDKMLELI